MSPYMLIPSVTERKQVLKSILFLVQKRDSIIKARHVANGSRQWNWVSSEVTSSPSVLMQSVLLSAVINAEEWRDVAVTNIPNAFIQTEINELDKDGNHTIMKI